MEMDQNTEKVTVLHPDRFLKAMGIEVDKGRRVLSLCFSFLASMEVGAVMETNRVKVRKLAPDLLYIDVDLDGEELLDTLERNSVLRVPV